MDMYCGGITYTARFTYTAAVYCFTRVAWALYVHVLSPVISKRNNQRDRTGPQIHNSQDQLHAKLLVPFQAARRVRVRMHRSGRTWTVDPGRFSPYSDDDDQLAAEIPRARPGPILVEAHAPSPTHRAKHVTTTTSILFFFDLNHKHPWPLHMHPCVGKYSQHPTITVVVTVHLKIYIYCMFLVSGYTRCLNLEHLWCT